MFWVCLGLFVTGFYLGLIIIAAILYGGHSEAMETAYRKGYEKGIEDGKKIALNQV